MNLVEQMLQKYATLSEEKKQHALREVMQEIALASLHRAGFFDQAAFYGGTCLRIFYELPRFSEDLDFSLLSPSPSFSFEPYFQIMQEEFAALGFQVEITEKKKTAETAIASAFLKKNSSIFDIHVQGAKTLKIKFEVDTDPPLGFVTEEKLLLQPYSFYVKCFSLPDLYAGKMHALLFRKWKNRVKGRDWYDFEWYIRKGAMLSLSHLTERAKQSGDWQGGTMTQQDVQQLLKEKINNLDIRSAREDVARFVPDPQQLNIWSADYFVQLVEKIKTK